MVIIACQNFQSKIHRNSSARLPSWILGVGDGKQGERKGKQKGCKEKGVENESQ